MSKPKIRHLAIVTIDPEKLAKFYCEVFDMEEMRRLDNGGIFVTDGYLTLALLRNRALGKPSGLNHFGFQIDDAEEMVGKLADFGIATPENRPADRGYAETRFADPDGNNVDLSVHGYQEMETVEDREKAKLEKV